MSGLIIGAAKGAGYNKKMAPDPAQKDDATTPPVVLFDGVCKLCNRSVNTILRMDRKGRLKFASLQSDYGRTVLTAHGRQSDPMDTMMLLEGGRLTIKSTALIRMTRYLGGVWPLAMVALIIPRFIRDVLYDLVAKNRYRTFGKYDTCRLPDPKYTDRFYR